MRNRLALLCPGQGAQGPAMFDMARSDAATAARLDGWLAGAGLDQPLETILADPGLLFANRMAQPLIVAASLATWTALGSIAAQPAIVAGYSIGELTAHAVAGSLAPGDAVRLARQRAGLMDACLQGAPPQALVALSGIAGSSAEAIARAHGFYPAIDTAEDSLIVGGPLDARTALVQAVATAGGRASALPVEVASHTPFMAGAVAPFAGLLRAQGWRAPQAPVISGIAAEPLHAADKAIDHLSRQLAEPIRWREGMDALAEGGVTVALELGPGAALARMLGARHPGIACRSVADFRSLDGVRTWLGKHIE
ncbi:acyltransferase domain-containing protein [Massilia sp. IC2-278]|uniref:ACP S-malonyltransferase n=1 Tax=Massilia sp. IC2-278 TaxID=2887200 RepID=UPI001E44AA7C|nr:acyltransferase domain-containing protein [Massilia sp. IC2-278]MCC2958884.1 acyltransferase domain-containing protein [Massilia sp. IC2-278]